MQPGRRAARGGGEGSDGAAAGAPAGSPCDFSRPASSASLARAAAAVGSDSSAGADRLYAEVDRQVRQYLLLKTAVCLGVGLLVGVIFSLLQLELAFLFGLVTFVANYVPNVGAIFATVLPLPLVLLDPSVSGAQQLLAFLLPLGAHMLVGNVLEPKLFGSSMELHPVVVLLALAFWGSLWGVSGAILSVPLTATADRSRPLRTRGRRRCSGSSAAPASAVAAAAPRAAATAPSSRCRACAATTWTTTRTCSTTFKTRRAAYNSNVYLFET